MALCNFSPNKWDDKKTLTPGTSGIRRPTLEGQVVVVPHNFVVVKQAGEEGAEWVSFNTNENGMINTLSGRTSALRGLPVDVITHAYQISEEEAVRLKLSRQETFIFSGSGRSYRGRRAASA